VVQDLSSQLSLQYALINSKIAVQNQEFRAVNHKSKITEHKSMKVWDVCSGAGGKTILFKSIYPGAEIIASDIRSSILQNLKTRAGAYRLDNIITLTGDATVNTDFVKPYAPFDFIICDVPCSGSGTWARTPEYFCFFDDKDLSDFSARQLNITCNAQQRLRAGGYLCYITCSVFKEENENVIMQLVAKTGLKLLHKQIIDGTKVKADSMFVALLQR
jgi:16S rRNA (cytosine967-C5)-methyltransferase